ncbi:DUF3265 domain-containing protein [Vibrio parahaemolyticus]|nr:DUF3265 domain-containing protein [Vibrio parahaemolyticus]MBM4801152.1 DUF3265 domain-containing protein [Vibrio parahaemolyticus]MBM4964431.1 DUF3265 domain-containing protein [Vibrio parahaemolyticus]
MTNCSRVIRHAWHFYYALGLVIKVVCVGFDIACLTPKQGVSLQEEKRSYKAKSSGKSSKSKLSYRCSISVSISVVKIPNWRRFND